MRLVPILAALSLWAVAAPAAAQQTAATAPATTPVAVASPPTGGTPAAKAEVEFGTKKLNLPFGESTEVNGKFDAALAGTWLVSENHTLPGGPIYPVLQLYRIDVSADGKPAVHWFALDPPAETKAGLLEAQRKQREWWPAEGDVAAIRAAVAKNPPTTDPKLRAKHVVSTPPDLPTFIKDQPEAKGAKVVVQSLFQPVDRPTYGHSYFVDEVSAERLSGKLTMGAVPQALEAIPIPVGTRGSFRWIRLSPTLVKKN